MAFILYVYMTIVAQPSVQIDTIRCSIMVNRSPAGYGMKIVNVVRIPAVENGTVNGTVYVTVTIPENVYIFHIEVN